MRSFYLFDDDGQRRKKGSVGRVERGNLYDVALTLLSGSSKESCSSCMFENFPYAIVHFGGTFEIFRCSNFTSNRFSL
jgi:hypothetical protein